MVGVQNQRAAKKLPSRQRRSAKNRNASDRNSFVEGVPGLILPFSAIRKLCCCVSLLPLTSPIITVVLWCPGSVMEISPTSERIRLYMKPRWGKDRHVEFWFTDSNVGTP